jgi:hypothetical protein
MWKKRDKTKESLDLDLSTAFVMNLTTHLVIDEVWYGKPELERN